MDTSGENQTRVDTNQKEEADKPINTTTLNEEEKQSISLSVDINDSITSNKTSDPAEVEISSKEDVKPTPIEDSKPPQQQENLNQTNTNENQAEKSKEEVKDGKEDPTSPQPKRWKTNRKKKNKTDEDSTQWPTPTEARFSKTAPPKRNSDSSSSRPSRRQERNSRYKKGINWKPLMADLSSNTTTQDQQGGGSSGQLSGSPTNASTTSSNTTHAPSHYGGGGGRNSGSGHRRRGGYRGGGGGASSGHWRGGSSASQGQSQPQTQVQPQAQAQGQGQGQGQVVGQGQTAVSTAATQTSSSGTDLTTNPPQADATSPRTDNTESSNAAGTYSDSRRFRGPSSRGRGGNRWRGGGTGYGRGSYYGGRYSAPRGSQVFSPLRVPPDPEQQKEQIKRQIEYYFGTDNLCRDVYLRKNMDNDGWLSTSMISNFNRVKELNADRQQLLNALKDSTLVEVKEGGDYIRRRDDWAHWLFPPRKDVVTTSTEEKKEGATTESESITQS